MSIVFVSKLNGFLCLLLVMHRSYFVMSQTPAPSSLNTSSSESKPRLSDSIKTDSKYQQMGSLFAIAALAVTLGAGSIIVFTQDELIGPVESDFIAVKPVPVKIGHALGLVWIVIQAAQVAFTISTSSSQLSNVAHAFLANFGWNGGFPVSALIPDDSLTSLSDFGLIGVVNESKVSTGFIRASVHVGISHESLFFTSIVLSGALVIGGALFFRYALGFLFKDRLESNREGQHLRGDEESVSTRAAYTWIWFSILAVTPVLNLLAAYQFSGGYKSLQLSAILFTILVFTIGLPCRLSFPYFSGEGEDVPFFRASTFFMTEINKPMYAVISLFSALDAVLLNFATPPFQLQAITIVHGLRFGLVTWRRPLVTRQCNDLLTASMMCQVIAIAIATIFSESESTGAGTAVIVLTVIPVICVTIYAIATLFTSSLASLERLDFEALLGAIETTVVNASTTEPITQHPARTSMPGANPNLMPRSQLTQEAPAPTLKLKRNTDISMLHEASALNNNGHMQSPQSLKRKALALEEKRRLLKNELANIDGQIEKYNNETDELKRMDTQSYPVLTEQLQESIAAVSQLKSLREVAAVKLGQLESRLEHLKREINAEQEQALKAAAAPNESLNVEMRQSSRSDELSGHVCIFRSVLSYIMGDIDASAWINAQHFGEENESGAALEEQVKSALVTLEATCNQRRRAAFAQWAILLEQLPTALREVEDVAREANRIKSLLADIDKHVSDVDETTTKAVCELFEVDKVKQSVEGCIQTLSQVHSWKHRIDMLQTFMESRDYHHIASEIASLFQGLEMTRDLPEFEQREGEVEEFCERLEVMISPHVLEAIEVQNASQIDTFSQILIRIRRPNAVRRLYLEARDVSIETLVDGALSRNDPINVHEWLETFLCGDVLPALDSEMTWKSQSEALCDSISSSQLCEHAISALRSRLEAWITACIESQQSEASQALVTVSSACRSFLVRLVRQLKLEPLRLKASVDSLFKPFVSPVEPFHRRWSDLEKKCLWSIFDISQLGGVKSLGIPSDASADAQGSDAFFASLVSTNESVLKAADQALERCIDLSAGAAAKNLSSSLDSFISEVVQRYFFVLRRARASTGLDSQTTRVASTFWSDLASPFWLLTCSRELRSIIFAFDRRAIDVLSSSISPLLRLLTAAVDGDDSVDTADNIFNSCLLQHDAESIAYLESMVKSASSDAHLLPQSIESSKSLVRGVRTLVFDSIFQPILARVQNLESWDIWTAASSSEGDIFIQVSNEIAQAADYLFTLVQQLELITRSNPTLSSNDGIGESTDPDIGLDGNVMLQLKVVADHFMQAVVDRIVRLEKLSTRGASQLETDAQYILTIVYTLGLDPLPALVVLKNVASCEELDLEKMEFDSTEALELAKRIAVLRGIDVHWNGSVAVSAAQAPSSN